MDRGVAAKEITFHDEAVGVKGGSATDRHVGQVGCAGHMSSGEPDGLVAAASGEVEESVNECVAHELAGES